MTALDDAAATRWDVIVAGAGSSGAVVAARLAESGARTLLIEAGQDFPDEHVRPPAFYVGGNLFGENYAGAGAPVPALDWGFESVPMRSGRVLPLARGKLVGGSSMINAALAVWPSPKDLAVWEQVAGAEWGWDALQPYFDRVRSMTPIRTYERERWLPFQSAWVEAMQEYGFHYHSDLNAPDAWDGVVGAYPQNRRNEVRQGTLVTYVRQARQSPHLTILPDTLVDRVLLGDGGAQGLVVRSTGGRPVEVRGATTVVSAGVYGSGSILQRSGVGPAEHLATAGVDQVVDLPVGRHLFEHLQTLFVVDLPAELSAAGWPGLSVVARGTEWATFPTVIDEENRLGAIAFQLLEQAAGGVMRVASSDPYAPPLVDHRFDALIDAGPFDGAWAEFAKILGTPTMARHGVTFHDDGLSLEERLRATMATSWHPAGGCAIGDVVDSNLRVHGIANLVVADASVFPHHSSHNPNLTCLVVGEKAADLLVDG